MNWPFLGMYVLGVLGGIGIGLNLAIMLNRRWKEKRPS